MHRLHKRVHVTSDKIEDNKAGCEGDGLVNISE